MVMKLDDAKTLLLGLSVMLGITVFGGYVVVTLFDASLQRCDVLVLKPFTHRQP